MSRTAQPILIVEDDTDIRELLAEILELEGYGVVACCDGVEALRHLAHAELPSLILLDWRMPYCDGGQFRAAQLSDPRLATIPVILVTADPRPRERAAGLGIDVCLAKPLDLAGFLAVVHRYVENTA